MFTRNTSVFGCGVYRFVFCLSAISWKTFPDRVFTRSVKNCLSDSDVLEQNSVVFRAYIQPPPKQHTLLIWATLRHKSSYITGNSYIKCCLLVHGRTYRVERHKRSRSMWVKDESSRRKAHTASKRNTRDFHSCVLCHSYHYKQLRKDRYWAAHKSWLVFKWSYIKVYRYGAHQYSLPFYGKSRI